VSNLPKRIHIVEEGPREGFQIESAGIPTARKLELIDALSETGLPVIQVTSFVNPKAVPGMADADAVIKGLKPREGVEYTALWLNEKGFERALSKDKLTLRGQITLSASEAFLTRNQRRTHSEHAAEQRRMTASYLAAGIPVETAAVMASFGCNFQGDIPHQVVLGRVDEILSIAAEAGTSIGRLSLLDTMAWATPASVEALVGMLRDRHPSLDLCLHLHDTRGLAMANAYAGLRLGIAHFDAAVGGLGGCPFAGHAGAAGNICTEDFVLMAEELGVATGVDLDSLIECARLAEDIVGHALPGRAMRGGPLRQL